MSFQGIDCASTLTATVAANLKSQGILYVGRYLGNGWQAMYAAEAAIIKNAGLKIISIYERNSTYKGYFTVAQGQTDAATAVACAKAVGQPAGSTIYFAVDYPAVDADYPAITAYFNAVKAHIGSDYVVGAYGHYGVMEYLHSNNIVKYFFQTIAWSGGKEASDFIHIFQHVTNVSMAGIQVDKDDVLRDPGAWGQDVPAPPVKPTPDPTPKPAPVVVPDTYTVKAGDSLSEICAKYNLDLATIESYNHITHPNLIQVGQVLHLKAPVPAPKPILTYKHYTVVSGDTLSELAVKFHTTVTELKSLNGIKDEDVVYAGQVIKVPTTADAAPEKPATPTTYKIEPGDKLELIAVKFHTTVSALMKLNRIANPNKIYAGQVIRVK